MVWLPQDAWAGRPLTNLAPGEAADAALRIFCTPRLSQWRPANHPRLTERARRYLHTAEWRRIATPVAELQTYTFVPGMMPVRGTVLVIHGWTGEASFMTAVGEAIRRAGFRVVLFDLPAHGLSEGRATNLMDCARAAVYLAERIGAIDAIVTHSFGSMIALLAIEGAPPMPWPLAGVKALALVSSPNRLTGITAAFADHWQLPAPARRAFEHRLERIGRRSIDTLNVAKLLRAHAGPVLLLHANDDKDVPVADAHEINAAVPATELMTFDGLGHRNVLFASQVTRKIAAFVTRAVA